MLKRHAINRIIKTSLILFILLLLCIFPKNDQSFPEEVIYIEEPTLPIYAIDKYGYVARTMTTHQSKQNDIEYVVSLLTINSINSVNLPLEFLAIIPENTELLSYDLKDGLLKLNFSKELLNIDSKNVERMLESLIFSLCEFNEIDKIMLFVENELLTNIPGTNIVIPSTLDKNYGINKEYQINDIKKTTKVTIYYLGKTNNNVYYIPITKITNTSQEAVEVIVNELKSTPIYETNLISYLNASYELQDYQILENAIHLSFNNALIANLEEKDIEEKVKYTLALSLRDTYNINDIVITIN